MSFPHERRLTRRHDFVRCYDGGRRFFSSNFVLFAFMQDNSAIPWRLGMAVTRKAGSAVWRNRIRRLIRECFRLTQESVPPGYDYVVVPKRSLLPQTATLASVTAEILPLLRALAQRKYGLAVPGGPNRRTGPCRHMGAEPAGADTARLQPESEPP